MSYITTGTDAVERLKLIEDKVTRGGTKRTMKDDLLDYFLLLLLLLLLRVVYIHVCVQVFTSNSAATIDSVDLCTGNKVHLVLGASSRAYVHGLVLRQASYTIKGNDLNPSFLSFDVDLQHNILIAPDFNSDIAVFDVETREVKVQARRSRCGSCWTVLILSCSITQTTKPKLFDGASWGLQYGSGSAVMALGSFVQSTRASFHQDEAPVC